MDFDIFRGFQIDTYWAVMYVECVIDTAGELCGWTQSFDDGAGFEELVIAVVSHHDTVHVVR